ncbi:NAD-dependent epimerase/dehydratase family protein [Sagittula sp. S175]|uniref:NAD-dependent epimerase/dehydratase family protein n=1 Tax=Sagittula sp. S175 TaxID=3415129 RepID=UPI003C7A024D
MAARRVLITGYSGFTGRYVATELRQAGWEVWGIGSGASDQGDLAYRQVDLGDLPGLTSVLDDIRPDAVVHLAAVAFVAHGEATDFYRVNVIGTHNLLTVLDKGGYGAQGVVLASSANIYGNTTVSPIPETADPAPENDYAVSKLAMEHMARLFAGKLPVTIARPFNYTGRGQELRYLVPKIVDHFRRRAPLIELGNLDVARDFSDVRDVALAYRALLEAGPQPGAVNICSGRATSLFDLIEMCRNITGHDIEVVVNPAFQRANEIKMLCGSRDRLNALTGAQPRNDLRDTLHWMLQD